MGNRRQNDYFVGRQVLKYILMSGGHVSGGHVSRSMLCDMYAGKSCTPCHAKYSLVYG